jgi:DNA repair protein SbcD/Mre11
MKLLHTSDWHLGRSLYEKKRYEEFAQFLDWLIRFIREEKIDILLVAGDIFDTTTPNNQVQEMYYRFLAEVSQTGCRHVVITGGNHDSPSFLNAPRQILRALHVHVIGDISGNPEDEVITIQNASGEMEAVVCAVPYLRDRDVRTAEAGESPEDKRKKLTDGISGHYAEVARIALGKTAKLPKVPIIGMGHLFTSGGKTVEGDGVRELYVGTLAYVDEKMFPASFDYLALGHLHMVQQVGDSEFKRYSGSPIAMGFGEADQEKKVIVAEFGKQLPCITEHTVPCFRRLERISGDREKILNRISELSIRGSNAWLEIDLTDPIPAADLTLMIEEAMEGTGMEICRIKNRIITERALKQAHTEETLDDLSETDVFSRLLDEQKEMEPQQREELTATFQEILLSMKENDVNAD